MFCWILNVERCLYKYCHLLVRLRNFFWRWNQTPHHSAAKVVSNSASSLIHRDAVASKAQHFVLFVSYKRYTQLAFDAMPWRRYICPCVLLWKAKLTAPEQISKNKLANLAPINARSNVLIGVKAKLGPHSRHKQLTVMFESSCQAAKLKNSFCGHLLLARWLADGASAASTVEKTSGMLVRWLRFWSAARRQASVGPCSVKISGVKPELFTVETIVPHRSLFFYYLSNTFLSVHKSMRCICTRKSIHSRFTCNLILADTQRKLTSDCSYRFGCCSTTETAAVEASADKTTICCWVCILMGGKPESV